MDGGKGNSAAWAHEILASLIAPLLAMARDWGDLPKTEKGRMQKLNFEGDFSSFVTFLDSNCIKKKFFAILTSNCIFRDENGFARNRLLWI